MILMMYIIYFVSVKVHGYVNVAKRKKEILQIIYVVFSYIRPIFFCPFPF